MPRVTVAIPTVSRLGYLREALGSVEAQTFRDFEILIGDNSACVDYATRIDELVAAFGHLDIRIYHHSRDIGMVANANFLVQAGRGEFWIYLPDDDRLTPNCLATLVAALDAEPRAGLAFSDHVVMDAEGRVDRVASDANSLRYGRCGLRAGYHPLETLFDLALAQVFELQSMLFRRSVIRALGFRESADSVPDFDLQLRLWSAPMEGAVYCATRLNEYRQHKGQATGTGDPCRAHRATIGALESAAPANALERPHYRTLLASLYATLAIHEAHAGEHDLARANARRALALAPWRLRPIAAVVLSRAPPTFVRGARSSLRVFRDLVQGLRARKIR